MSEVVKKVEQNVSDLNNEYFMGKKEEIIKQLKGDFFKIREEAFEVCEKFKMLYISVFQEKMNKEDFKNEYDVLRLSLKNILSALSKMYSLMVNFGVEELSLVGSLIESLEKTLEFYPKSYKEAKICGEFVFVEKQVLDSDEDFFKMNKILRAMSKYPFNKKIEILYSYANEIISKYEKEINFGKIADLKKVETLNGTLSKEIYGKNRKKILKTKKRIDSFYNQIGVGLRTFKDCTEIINKQNQEADSRSSSKEKIDFGLQKDCVILNRENYSTLLFEAIAKNEEELYEYDSMPVFEGNAFFSVYLMMLFSSEIAAASSLGFHFEGCSVSLFMAFLIFEGMLIKKLGKDVIVDEYFRMTRAYLNELADDLQILKDSQEFLNEFYNLSDKNIARVEDILKKAKRR